MSNVAKLKKKAAEFELKRQFDKALAVYIELLDSFDENPTEVDVALFNRVGDMLLRQGNVADALDYYERAVDRYAEGGFFNNAIALCNKILRQSPARTSVYYKLGKISAQKGFKSDAKQNFLEYADRMQKAGRMDEAFRALKEFADLCPDQDDIRLMLAEQLSRQSRAGEAIEQLQTLYDRYSASGRDSEARATLDRILAIDPSYKPRVTGQQSPQRSSELVFLDVYGVDVPSAPTPVRPAMPRVPDPRRQTPVSGAPGTPPPLAPPQGAPADDLGPSFGGLTGVPGHADEDRTPTIEGVAGLQTTPDFVASDDEAGDEAATAADHALEIVDHVQPTGADDIASVEGLQVTSFDLPAAAGEAAAIEGFDFIERGESAAAEGFDFLERGESPRAEGFDFLERGDSPTGDGFHFLEGVDSQGASEGFIAGVGFDFLSGAGESDLSPSAPVDDLDAPFLHDVQAAPSVDLPDPRPAAVESVEPGTEASVPETSPDEYREGPEESTIPGMLGLTELSFERSPGDPATAFPPSSEMPSGDAVGGAGDGEGELAFLEAWAAERATPSEPPPVVEAPPTAEMLGLITADALEAPPETDDAPSAAGEGPVDRLRGSTVAAEQTVERLESEAATRPDDLELRRRLGEARLESGDRSAGIADLEAVMVGYERREDLGAAAAVADQLARLTPRAVRIQQKRVEFAFRTNDRHHLVVAYLDLASALLSDGQPDKARTVYKRVLDLAPDDITAQAGLAALSSPAAPERTPTQPPQRVVTPPPVTTAPSTPARAPRVTTPRESVWTVPTRAVEAGPGPLVNLGDLLRDEEGPKSTRMVVEEKEPTGDEEADFAEMLRKFKQGVAENVDAEDHQSHYDLGVAFKEMGLIDEAIAEFQKALRAPSNRLPTYEALGQCFVQKGQHQIANAILVRALGEQHVADEQLIGVLYLLGVAAEALGRHQDATDFYQRVFVVDIEFRDVADRLAALTQARR